MKPWSTRKLGDIAKIRRGASPRPKGDPRYFGGNIPWLKIGDVPPGSRYVSHTEEGVTPAGRDLSVYVKPHTLLLSNSASVGRPVITKIGACIHDGWLALEDYESELRQDFLYWCLIWSQAEFQRLAPGGTQKNLNINLVSEFKVPVPPMEDQERIVEVLDEADVLRKLGADADRRTGELIPSFFHEMFNAEKSTKTLRDLADVVSGVAKGRKFRGEQPVTVPYVRVANVQDGYLDLAELKTIEALPNEVKELELKRGDVLLTEGGDFDKLGRGAMLEQDLPGCIHQNHVFRVRCDQSKLLPEYFAGFLLSANARLYFRQCAKKTSNLASINMSQLRALPVPAASLPEQKKFAQRITEIRQLKSTQTDSRLRLENLFQSLLHRAFNGEL